MIIYQGGVVVAMARNPSLIRSEPPMASDLTSSDCTLLRGGASLRRRDLIFVVNPRGANGTTVQQWKKLLPYLRSRLGNDCNICESLTSGPSHAIDITREAIREGADAVIAVGGDGTLHEVVNGFFCGGKPVCNHDMNSSHSTALGIIPLGTGSDFARTLGWKNDPHDAIERIAKGLTSKIDVGCIAGEIGESHYFINVADIHLSAKAGYYASRYKKFGNLCYVIGALQAFFRHHNQDLRIKVDEGEWEVCSQVTALCIGNAKYFGGGMKITPNANPSSGDYEVVILQDFKWYDFILKLHKLYNGTHLSVKNVSSRSFKLTSRTALYLAMATFTSFASIRIPNLQSGDRRSIFRPNSSQKILKLSRCNVENSTSNSSNNTSTSTSSQDSESENLLLKMAWYGSEFLGIAASFFRSPTGTEAPSEANLELATDGSGIVDRALVVDIIKDDFQRSYFVTGNLTLNAYEENCEFADPAGSFKGLSRFKRNCTNFGYLVETSNMKLMKWEDFEDKAIGHWRFSCILSFPWKPILSATGYTEYYFNEKSGKVCRHIEHWNVPKMALLKQIIRPSRGKKASG